jgi:hypothetical protein
MTTNRLPDHKPQATLKKNEESQKQISNWIATHKDHYISHSIPANRTDEVFHHGKLRPTEEVLRKDFKCEINPKFENISRLIHDYKNESKASERKPLPERFVMHNNLPLSVAAQYHLFLGSNYLEFINHLSILPETSTLPSLTLKDGKTYQITRNKKGDKSLLNNTFFQIEGLPYLEVFNPNLPLNDLSFAWFKRYDLYAERAAQIAIDMLATQTIDSQLAIIWQTYKTLTYNQASVWSNLLNSRSNAIRYSVNPSCNLDASKNEITWTTDTIQILRGNPESTYCAMQNTSWTPLLHPWENNGEMFSLDLSEVNTIIIGPRAQLEPYVTKNSQPVIHALNETEYLPPVITPAVEGYARKYKIFYFEDMTKEQLKFFNVPAHLNPDTRLAAEKLRGAMGKIEMTSKSRAFNQWRLFAENAGGKRKDIDEAAGHLKAPIVPL